MSKNSRHGQKMSKKFENQERDRRELAGKQTEAPAKPPTRPLEDRH